MIPLACVQNNIHLKKTTKSAGQECFMLGDIETSILIGYNDKQFEEYNTTKQVPWQAAIGQPIKLNETSMTTSGKGEIITHW